MLDIKAEGGLAKVIKKVLEEICDNNKVAFGTPASQQRKKVQNKIDYLKNNPKSYEKLQRNLFGSIIDTYTGYNIVTYVTSTPVKTAKSEVKPINLSRDFEKISIDNRYAHAMSKLYGKVSYDDTHKVKPEAWKNRGGIIWKAQDVNVGTKPTISTDIYTLMVSGIDPRYFMINDFEPYKLTQVSPTELVYEEPCAPYEFLFGDFDEMEMAAGDNDNDVQEELEDEEKGKMETEYGLGNLVVSQNKAEQKAYVIQQHDLTVGDNGKTPDYSTY